MQSGKISRLALVTLFTLVMIDAQALHAQVTLPRPSPKASLTQTVGLTEVTITYSRPGVKGREIWGKLVPYNKVWRTGANEATTFSVSDDVLIDGHVLAKEGKTKQAVQLGEKALAIGKAATRPAADLTAFEKQVLDWKKNKK